MSAKILLVDPDPTSVERLQGLLEGSGFEVVVAADAARALEVFERCCPDLTLVEAVLPNVNGVDLVWDIKQTERGRQTPVVVFGNPGERDPAYEAVYDRWIDKPVTEQLLAGLCAESLPREVRAAGTAGTANAAPHELLDDADIENTVDRLDAMLEDFEPPSAAPGAGSGPEPAARPAVTDSLLESIEALERSSAPNDPEPTSVITNDINEFRVDLPEKDGPLRPGDTGADIGAHLDDLFAGPPAAPEEPDLAPFVDTSSEVDASPSEPESSTTGGEAFAEPEPNAPAERVADLDRSPVSEEGMPSLAEEEPVDLDRQAPRERDPLEFGGPPAESENVDVAPAESAEGWIPSDPVPDVGSVVHFEDEPLDGDDAFRLPETDADAPAGPAALELNPRSAESRRQGLDLAPEIIGPSRGERSALRWIVPLAVVGILGIGAGAAYFFINRGEATAVPPVAPSAASTRPTVVPAQDAAAAEHSSSGSSGALASTGARAVTDDTPIRFAAGSAGDGSGTESPGNVEPTVDLGVASDEVGAALTGGPSPEVLASDPPPNGAADAMSEQGAPDPTIETAPVETGLEAVVTEERSSAPEQARPLPADRDVPVLLRRVEPTFPLAERPDALPQVLVLNLLVGENGRVIRVEVARGIEDKRRENVAILAVTGWEFDPAIEDGYPVSRWVTEEFEIRP